MITELLHNLYLNHKYYGLEFYWTHSKAIFGVYYKFMSIFDEFVLFDENMA